jgi:hypothetical protein
VEVLLRQFLVLGLVLEFLDLLALVDDGLDDVVTEGALASSVAEAPALATSRTPPASICVMSAPS